MSWLYREDAGAETADAPPREPIRTRSEGHPTSDRRWRDGVDRQEAYASRESGVDRSIGERDEDFRSREQQAIDKPAIANVAGHLERPEGIQPGDFRAAPERRWLRLRGFAGQISHISSANVHLRRDPAD